MQPPFYLPEADGVGQPRHGGEQSSAGVGRGRGDAGRRRQRHRCGDRHAVHADRGRADDGRHHRRRHGAHSPRRRQPPRHRRAEHRAARGEAGHLSLETRLGARRVRHRRRREPDRAEIRRRAGLAESLVRDAAALRHHEPCRCHAARDQACRARLCRDAVPARMHRRRRRRDAEGQADLEDLSARGQAAEGRRAVVQSEYARDAAHIDREGGRGGAVWRAARRHPRRLHGEERRLHHAQGSRLVQDGRARADQGELPRLGNPRAAAARSLRRAHRADAEHPRRL